MTVYIFRQLNSNYFKIGFTDSNDVDIRRQSLQTGNPHKLIVFRVFDNAPIILEQTFHRVLLAFRTNGGSEWFELPEDILNQFINSIANEPEEFKQNYEGLQRHFRTEGTTSWVNRNDVRPLCGGQQDSTAGGSKDVFFAGHENFVYTGHKYDILLVSKKYDQCFKTDWGEAVQGNGGCDAELCPD